MHTEMKLDFCGLSSLSFRGSHWVWSFWESFDLALILISFPKIFNQHKPEQINLIKWFKDHFSIGAGYIVC